MLGTVDILNLEFPNIDRDMHIVTPVNLYLRKHYKLSVTVKNLHNALFYIFLYRPRLVYISNAHGDDSTFKLIRLLNSLGIKVVTLVTEGNFQETFIHGYLWGWNTDYKLYQEVMILWNEHSRNSILQFHPELETQVRVSGATGFDRYFLMPFMSKEQFLKDNNLQYRKVIGIAGFGLFDHLDNYKMLKTVIPDMSLEAFDVFKEDLEKLRKIYRAFIMNNPDILFILRMHPQLVSKVHRSEFSECVDLKNVYISSSYGNLPNIADAINISDIWLGYESTTSLEAWLLRKMVVYINPTTADFQRENHYKGCLIVQTLEELQSVANEFYQAGIPAAYQALEPERKAIIKKVIEYDDGKNHQRAAGIIYESYKKAQRPSFRTMKKLAKLIDWPAALRFVLYKYKWYFKLRKKLVRPDANYPKEKNQVKQYEKMYEPYI